MRAVSRFSILGPLEVTDDGHQVRLPGGRAETVLALLCVSPGQVISKDRLIDAAWNGSPPASAVTRLHVIVSDLRRVLPDGLIRTSGTGYALTAEHDQTDLGSARQLITRARAHRERDDLPSAAKCLAEALALWRGRPFDGISCTELEMEAERITHERVSAQEEYADLELRLGNHVPQLAGWVAENPLREGLRASFMRALARSGRQAEAIATYHDLREQLAEHLGVDPAPEPRDLYQAIVNGDRELLTPAPGQRRTVPAQLPADTGDFTGRAAQLRTLRDALSPRDGGRIAVGVAAVSGAGGVGKSTLALHAAHLAANDFPDGQLYVNLAGTSGDPAAPGDVLGRLLRDLGIPAADVPADESEREGRYRSLLAGRRILLVLDDAHNAAQVRPLLPGSAGCAVLVTSRTRLNGLVGAHHHDLDVMSETEERELFDRIAGAARAAREPAATMGILRACGGLPLAIRIAAIKIAARPGWSIAATAARLAAEHDRLAELHVGDLAVRASFELGYDSIDPAARRAFRLLGVAGLSECRTGAAAALLDTSIAEAGQVLEILTDAHLLQAPEPDTYRMHDLLRLFSVELGQSQLSEAEREQALDRLLTWYASALHTAATILAAGRPMPPGTKIAPARAEIPVIASHSAALAWCQRDYGTLVWAIKTAAEHQRHDLAVTLACSLWMYTSLMGEWDSFVISQQTGLNSARLLDDKPQEAWLLNGLGAALRRAGHYEQAFENFEESLRIRRRLGDAMGEAACHNNLANVRFDQGRYAEAVDHYTAAAAIAEATGSHSHLAGILLNAANTYREMGAYEDALDAYARSLEAASVVGDRHRHTDARTGMAETFRRLGRVAEAVEQFQHALAIHRELGASHRELLTTLDLLAQACSSLGRTEEAHQHWLEAARLAEDADDPRAAEFRGALAATRRRLAAAKQSMPSARAG
jgi:DNA-binding SARP family transcriptional activator/tetratricopeptide (TPR) repeat protein